MNRNRNMPRGTTTLARRPATREGLDCDNLPGFGPGGAVPALPGASS